MKSFFPPGFSKWYQQLAVGVLLILGTQGAGVLFLGYLGGLGYMLAGVTGAVFLGIATAVMERHTTRMFCLGLACLGAAFLSGFGMKHHVAGTTGVKLYGVDVAELVRHPDVVYAEFSEARIFKDYASMYSYSKKTRQSGTIVRNWQIAPLADPGWTPDKPVPAWVAHGDVMVPGSWDQPLLKGTVISGSDLDGDALLGAVRKAKERHGLQGDDAAPVLSWGVKPEDMARRWFRYAAWVIAIASVPWLWGVIFDGCSAIGRAIKRGPE